MSEIDDLRAQLAAAVAAREEAERERDEARWNPLEDYHKQHVSACRKHMYDPKSSPCTCRTEWERLLFEGKSYRERLLAAEARAERLRTALYNLKGAFQTLHHAASTGSYVAWPEWQDADAALAEEVRR